MALSNISCQTIEENNKREVYATIVGNLHF